MSAVARKLFRLLQRVRREYHHAQIPQVGVTGFHAPPVLDLRHLISVAFRGESLTAALGATPLRESDGFRALRQAQQQLQVLRSSEEETRAALGCWFQLCQYWARRLPYESTRIPYRNGRRLLSSEAGNPEGPSGPHGTDLRRPDAAEGDSQWQRYGGGGRPDGSTPSGEEGGGIEVSAAMSHSAVQPYNRVQLLAVALEEGALLVDRLYDAHHVRLDEYDEEAEELVGELNDARASSGSEIGNASKESGHCSKLRQTREQYGRLRQTGLPPDLAYDKVVRTAQRQLDELAAAVAAAHPALFPQAVTTTTGGAGCINGDGRLHTSDGASGPPPACTTDVLRQQLEAISQVLFHERRFRHDPVEWVYDGLAPALLPQVLNSRRGIPLSLAVLYCCVAARLGVAAVPMKAAAEALNSVAEGPAALHELPPEVAARHAGRSLALAPPLDCWVVAAGTAVEAAVEAAEMGATMQPLRAESHGSSEAEGVLRASGAVASGAGGPGGWGQQHQQRVWLVDVDRRGRVLTWPEAAQRYPDLQSTLLATLLPASPLELWSALARVMLTAHTRRGESDQVAHWLVQLLALEHRAPEWAVMMGAESR